MANIKSQIKRNKQNEKRRARNQATRSEISTLKKAAVGAVGTDQQDDTLKAALKKIDKAAAKGVMHKNKAARQKSRLVKQVTADKA